MFDVTTLAFDSRRTSDGTVDLVTQGLASEGHPELVVTDLSERWMPHARTLLTLCARFVAANGIQSGNTLDMPTSVGQLVVRFEPWPEDPSLFMLVDLSDIDEGCPYIALSTLWGEGAWFVLGEGKMEEAVAMLREAVEHQPVLADREPGIIYLYNWDGAMNLLLLAALVPEEQDALLEESFRRSEATRLRTLGDSVADLATLDQATLEHAAAMLTTSQFSRLEPIAGAETAVFTGPLAAEHDGMLHLDRSVVDLEVFIEITCAKVMDVLFDSDTHTLAAQVVLSRPPLLLYLESDAVLKLHAKRPHATQFNTAWVPGMRLVSMVLADFQRLLAGGAEVEDFPAYYGLVEDDAARDRVTAAAAAFDQMVG